MIRMKKGCLRDVLPVCMWMAIKHSKGRSHKLDIVRLSCWGGSRVYDHLHWKKNFLRSHNEIGGKREEQKHRRYGGALKTRTMLAARGQMEGLWVCDTLRPGAHAPLAVVARCPDGGSIIIDAFLMLPEVKAWNVGLTFRRHLDHFSAI